MFFQGRIFVFLFTLVVSVSTAYGQIQGEFVAGEYVVKMKSGMTRPSLSSMSVSLNAEIKDVVSVANHTMLVKKSIIERTDAVIRELSQHPMVELVEPNYIYRANILPNDPRMSSLWGLQNTQQGIDIDADLAWEITQGSRDIVVAVIDSGVNYRDPDLVNNMWVNEAEQNGSPGVDDDGNGFIDDIHGYDFANNDGDPMDDNDHGSHCAGTIGAEGDNDIGVVGVNWRVRIMALKFLTGSGGGTLDAALKSIDYATAQNVDIMSNSWGGGGRSQALEDAIRRAEEAGILFVAAAGNSRNNNDLNPSYPASYDIPNVLSVAAVDRSGNLASFSNYGRESVHIAAPGVDILSTGKSGLVSLSGTSMATPHVSGVAALLLANEPSLTYQEIRGRLLETSVPLTSLQNRVQFGFLNAKNALLASAPGEEPGGEPGDDSDDEEPLEWLTEERRISTAHPYANREDQTFTVQVPGAKRIAVHFSRFETENRFDKALFFDGEGNPLGELTGEHNDKYSPVAEGDTLVIRFVSDFIFNDYGFDIDFVRFQVEVEDQFRSFPDPVSTDHPYPNFFDREIVFEKPGAREIKIKFGRFETEERYDFVLFYDSLGQLLDQWDGDHSGEFSPVAQGEKIIVRLKTDFSVRKYGFDVERVHYR